MDHTVLADIVPYKSGLTPINVNRPPTGYNHEDVSEYQQRRFRGKSSPIDLEIDLLFIMEGFRTSMLQAMDVMAYFIRDTQEDRLEQMVVHPLNEKHRWLNTPPRHTAPIPLGKGREGYWQVSFCFQKLANSSDTALKMDEPIVWRAMEPVLKLASCILKSCHTSQWFDAFFNADRTEIDLMEFEKGTEKPGVRRFRRRNATQSVDENLVKDQIIAWGRNVDFGLGSGVSTPSLRLLSIRLTV